MPQPSENEIAFGFLEKFDPDARSKEVRRRTIEEAAEWLKARGALALAESLRHDLLD